MTPEQLAAIRERADKATPGKWDWWSGYELLDCLNYEEHKQTAIYALEPIPPARRYGPLQAIIKREDADFISSSREDVPALLDYIDELQKVLNDSP